MQEMISHYLSFYLLLVAGFSSICLCLQSIHLHRLYIIYSPTCIYITLAGIAGFVDLKFGQSINENSISLIFLSRILKAFLKKL